MVAALRDTRVVYATLCRALCGLVITAAPNDVLYRNPVPTVHDTRAQCRRRGIFDSECARWRHDLVSVLPIPVHFYEAALVGSSQAALLFLCAGSTPERQVGPLSCLHVRHPG